MHKNLLKIKAFAFQNFQSCYGPVWDDMYINIQHWIVENSKIINTTHPTKVRFLLSKCLRKFLLFSHRSKNLFSNIGTQLSLLYFHPSFFLRCATSPQMTHRSFSQTVLCSLLTSFLAFRLPFTIGVTLIAPCLYLQK